MNDELLGMMRKVFDGHECIKKVFLFGSRAKGTNTESSDVDIAIVGCDGLLFCEMIADELSAFPTLLKFDVIGYKNIKNAALLEHIDRVGIVIYERGKNHA